jgi:hypothetical protein
MEQVMIAALLEKYWLAETTVEEERQLAEYFRQPVIPAEWEPWRNVFAYFETEAQITPGEDFEARLLERIRQAEATAPGPSNSDLRAAPDPGPAYQLATAPVRPIFRRAPWWAAAAVIILALGISRLAESPGTVSPTSGEATAIKDTYDDPQQALAAIRRALGTASAKMNHGRNITQKQIDRMNDGLQSAIAN